MSIPRPASTRAISAAAALLAVACIPPNQYDYAARDGSERSLPAVHAEVVARATAEAHGTDGTPLVVEFGEAGETRQLVAQFLRRADQAGAAYVADLAIYLRSTADGAPVECRTPIVPESLTESTWRPARTEQVSVSRPVTRSVIEYERRCHQTTRMETRWVTEYHQRCQSVSRPVQRSRTVYRYSYDYASHSSRSTPTTEYYTAYEQRQECRSEPERRQQTAWVPHEECRSEPVTRQVTRYEFQLENRFVPGHLETLTRQRLRELEPTCYAVEDTAQAPGAGGNRIEGVAFRRR